MKVLKAIKNTIKTVINRIRTSKIIDKGEEMLLTAVLPVIITEITQGNYTITANEANKYAKEIVKGLNQVGDKVFGEVAGND